MRWSACCLPDDPDTTACRLVVAIAANLRDMAEGIVGDWSTGDTPYIRYFADPAPGNPLFASKAELAGRLLNSLYTELELIITQKLARPLDKSLERRAANAPKDGAVRPGCRP